MNKLEPKCALVPGFMLVQVDELSLKTKILVHLVFQFDLVKSAH